jgi:hypothetical protein
MEEKAWAFRPSLENESKDHGMHLAAFLHFATHRIQAM